MVTAHVVPPAQHSTNRVTGMSEYQDSRPAVNNPASVVWLLRTLGMPKQEKTYRKFRVEVLQEEQGYYSKMTQVSSIYQAISEAISDSQRSGVRVAQMMVTEAIGDNYPNLYLINGKRIK